MEIFLWAPLFFLGVWVLLRAASLVVNAAVRTMHRYNISASAFGIIVLAALTALPETFVSVIAALAGSDGLSYGNLLGSNTVNLPLVLGLSMFVGNGINIRDIVWTRRHAFFLSLAVLIGSITLLDLELSRLDGLLLLMVFCLYLYSIFISEWDHSNMDEQTKKEGWLWRKLENHREAVEEKKCKNLFQKLIHKPVVLLLFGTAGLIFGAQLMVSSARVIAESLHISELYIGLIALGFGTTLPEVASSLAAVKKGESAMGLSNVIGDNIATILLALGITGLIHPIHIQPVSLFLDIPLLIGVTLLFTLLIFFRTHISKKMSIISLIIFVAIIVSYTYLHCLSPYCSV